VIFLQIEVGAMKNFTYVIGDEESAEAAVIDPSWDLDAVLATVNENNLHVSYIINSHSHRDHTLGNQELANRTGAKIVAHRNARTQHDVSVDDGDIVHVGQLKVKIIYTPGHTAESICLLVENKLMTGDTLFVGECGRTDLPTGSSEQLYDSFFSKILVLDDDIEVCPGHHYGDRPISTIGHERKTNYTLKPRTKVEFINFINEPT